MEKNLIDVLTMRRFTCIELISNRNPDETTILTFRHKHATHNLGQQSFAGTMSPVESPRQSSLLTIELLQLLRPKPSVASLGANLVPA